MGSENNLKLESGTLFAHDNLARADSQRMAHERRRTRPVDGQYWVIRDVWTRKLSSNCVI